MGRIGDIGDFLIRGQWLREISGTRRGKVLISVLIYSKIIVTLSLAVGNQASISCSKVPGS